MADLTGRVWMVGSKWNGVLDVVLVTAVVAARVMVVLKMLLEAPDVVGGLVVDTDLVVVEELMRGVGLCAVVVLNKRAKQGKWLVAYSRVVYFNS